jgi:hypothetical protein
MAQVFRAISVTMATQNKAAASSTKEMLWFFIAYFFLPLFCNYLYFISFLLSFFCFLFSFFFFLILPRWHQVLRLPTTRNRCVAAHHVLGHFKYGKYPRFERIDSFFWFDLPFPPPSPTKKSMEEERRRKEKYFIFLLYKKKNS